MTQMSDLTTRSTRDRSRNHARTLGGSPLARTVHDRVSAVGFLVSFLVVGQLTGCVITPSLSVDNQDAGANSPPAVVAVRGEQSELPELGTVVFVPGEGSLNVELIDTDLLDTLYIRVFVDYQLADPKPARSTCTAAPTDNARRTVTCDATALCTVADTMTDKLLDMNVKVFDRVLLETGTPAFQAMPEGGLSTGKVFHLQCETSGA